MIRPTLQDAGLTASIDTSWRCVTVRRCRCAERSYNSRDCEMAGTCQFEASSREARFCIWQAPSAKAWATAARLQTRRVTHYFASAPTVHAHSMLRTLVGRAERDSKRLTILHFNDVYDVSADRAAKFVTVIRSYAEAEPLILFSGDCYSPSIMSVVSKGSQMPPVLNAIGVQAAVFGNHEFDWGLLRAEGCAHSAPSRG